jgi:dGTPase
MARVGTPKDFPLELSAGVAAAVEELVATGKKSPYATPNGACVRRYQEERDIPDPLRPAFVRDVEKILHTGAYNRLAGKTQVFSFRADDDITRRGLHVQLVARVARDIGTALGLNLDLIEAIALGHDVGHTPFGHAGERFLDKVYSERTGRSFMHNVHSVRVLDTLWGRNLSLQTLDGVLAHNGECEQQRFVTSGLTTFDELDATIAACEVGGYNRVKQVRPATLEGCVVRVSDIIAYVGKDRQDACRARYVDPECFERNMGGGYNSWALTVFITDVVEHSFGKDSIEMSEAAFEELRRAKRENYNKIYLTSEVSGVVSGAVEEMFGMVYQALLDELAAGNENTPIFAHHIRPVEEQLAYYGRTYNWQADPDRTVVDFIASMTDDYFVALSKRLFPHAPALIPSHTYFDDLKDEHTVLGLSL